jgi:hypothetical protein
MIRAMAFALAMFGLAMSASEASAWYCRASSATGNWGWGRSVYLANARAIALTQCAIRTPRGFTCYIRYCR